ncbi:hypothetical protein KIPB_001092 [Kipferlia bialata]|uniref:Telomerase reverse transcriptase n=1 Tax=Kipferlia bialata TaxID=797122 RepID=A0A9K3CRI8_9EUKA|nr:hypothetical protein KIPB_001092 [Kipferlia bialata]|eukprot:g1092.t1
MPLSVFLAALCHPQLRTCFEVYGESVLSHVLSLTLAVRRELIDTLYVMDGSGQGEGWEGEESGSPSKPTETERERERDRWVLFGDVPSDTTGASTDREALASVQWALRHRPQSDPEAVSEVRRYVSLHIKDMRVSLRGCMFNTHTDDDTEGGTSGGQGHRARVNSDRVSLGPVSDVLQCLGVVSALRVLGLRGQVPSPWLSCCVVGRRSTIRTRLDRLLTGTKKGARYARSLSLTHIHQTHGVDGARTPPPYPPLSVHYTIVHQVVMSVVRALFPPHLFTDAATPNRNFRALSSSISQYLSLPQYGQIRISDIVGSCTLSSVPWLSHSSRDACVSSHRIFSLFIAHVLTHVVDPVVRGVFHLTHAGSVRSAVTSGGAGAKGLAYFWKHQWVAATKLALTGAPYSALRLKPYTGPSDNVVGVYSGVDPAWDSQGFIVKEHPYPTVKVEVECSTDGECPPPVAKRHCPFPCGVEEEEEEGRSVDGRQREGRIQCEGEADIQTVDTNEVVGADTPVPPSSQTLSQDDAPRIVPETEVGDGGAGEEGVSRAASTAPSVSGTTPSLTPLSRPGFSARLRFIPKASGMRPVCNYAGRGRGTGVTAKSALLPLQYVLRHMVSTSGGSGVTVPSIGMERVEALRREAGGRPVYGCSCDAKSSYDTISRLRLIQAIRSGKVGVSRPGSAHGISSPTPATASTHASTVPTSAFDDTDLMCLTKVSYGRDPFKKVQPIVTPCPERDAGTGVRGGTSVPETPLRQGVLHDSDDPLPSDCGYPQLPRSKVVSLPPFTPVTHHSGAGLSALLQGVFDSSLSCLGREYTSTQGIPQGSTVSPALCNVYHTYMERVSALSGIPGVGHAGVVRRDGHLYLYVRYADDMLYLTTDSDAARHFASVHKAGLPSFSFQSNTDKRRVFLGDDTAHSGSDGDGTLSASAVLTWCGFSVRCPDGRVLLPLPPILGERVPVSKTATSHPASKCLAKTLSDLSCLRGSVCVLAVRMAHVLAKFRVMLRSLPTRNDTWSTGAVGQLVQTCTAVLSRCIVPSAHSTHSDTEATARVGALSLAQFVGLPLSPKLRNERKHHQGSVWEHYWHQQVEYVTSV